MKRTAFVLACVTTALLCHHDAVRAQAQRQAQKPDTWTAIQQLQSEIKADRLLVVSTNLPLTDAESKAFWPIYKE